MKMKKFALFMFQLTCKEASPLISEMMDHRVSLWTRLRVKIHLAMCKFCEYYKEQLDILRRLAGKLGKEDGDSAPEHKLSPEAREKLEALGVEFED